MSGQPRLESMSKQLEANGIFVDEKSCYKSDGLMKLFGFKKLEMLVLETSGHFGNTDRVKLKFDHHKGVLGMLTILKSVGFGCRAKKCQEPRPNTVQKFFFIK